MIPGLFDVGTPNLFVGTPNLDLLGCVVRYRLSLSLCWWVLTPHFGLFGWLVTPDLDRFFVEGWLVAIYSGVVVG